MHKYNANNKYEKPWLNRYDKYGNTTEEWIKVIKYLSSVGESKKG